MSKSNDLTKDNLTEGTFYKTATGGVQVVLGA